MADKYLNIDEVLSALNIEEDNLETLISNGEIKAYRTQGKVKFKETDVSDLADRIDSINMDSVIDDDELPSLSESSEVLPAVELEELEESDFTIELPDDIAAGDPSLSGSSLALEDEDAFALDGNDDFDLDGEEVEVGSDTNPSDITINADDLDLDLDDSGDSFATSDITIQDDDEDRYATSDLTVQEDAVNTSDLTVQEDAINTSELTVQDDAVNTSEMTVDDGFGTEASLTVQDGEFADDDDLEEDDDSASRSKRRPASSGSNRRSARSSGTYEYTQVSMLWPVFLVLTLVASLFSLQYILPYLYYNDNMIDEKTKVVIPKLLEGSKEWALKTFGDENRFPPVDAVLRFEMDTGDAAAVDGGGEEPN